jgi:hypothetical protein
MVERDVERAAEDLAARRRRAHDAFVLAGLALAASGLVAAISPRAALAFLVGSGIEALVAVVAVVGRRELVSRLALEPRAYVLPDVARHGMTVARQRHRLAAWVAEVVADGAHPGTIYLADRVARYAGELRALARDLADPAVAVRPPSAVACRRLLTHAVESPLYNPSLPADDVALAVKRIRAGIETA